MKKYLSALLILTLVVSLAIVAAPATPVKAATTINVPADNATITIAINTANPGDIINVTANLTENVMVNKKNLTIQGAWGSANNTITVATGNVSYPVFLVTADTGNNTTIKGFTIKGATDISGVYLDGGLCKVDSCNITNNGVGVSVNATQNRIIRNSISGNTRYGVHLPGVTEWNNVSYNDITNNTVCGVYADPVPGNPYWMQGASLNWWGSPSGPGGTTGVNEYVWYNPWLNSGYSGILASGIADISMAIPLQVGWNTLSTPLALASTENWSTIFTRSGLTSQICPLVYDYDPTRAEALRFGVIPNNSSMVLEPLDALFLKLTSSATVTLKINTLMSGMPTKDLAVGWNFIGAAMSITSRELDMRDVLMSVDETPLGLRGYDMVVSPPLATQPSWVYVKGQEGITEAAREAFQWEKMQFGRGYWIYMENADEFAGFSSTPITARVWD